MRTRAESVNAGRESREGEALRSPADAQPEARARRRRVAAATAANAPSAMPIRLVWTHVLQALQQTAAVGAFSPHFAAAWATRPVQISFTPRF